MTVMTGKRIVENSQTESNAAPASARAPLAFYCAVRGPYLIGSRELLADELGNRLVHVMRSGLDSEPPGILGGRSHGRSQDIEGLGRVFIKRYAHGGLLRAITSERFIATGSCRSEQEFLMLERVRALGV